MATKADIRRATGYFRVRAWWVTDIRPMLVV
jgi:hypothetical protein